MVEDLDGCDEEKDLDELSGGPMDTGSDETGGTLGGGRLHRSDA